jgi:antitoxin StbD
MESILANYSASITELKKSPQAIFNQSGGEPVAILNHNTPSFYLVSKEMFESMNEMLDDYQLLKEAKERLEDKEVPVKVSLDEL